MDKLISSLLCCSVDSRDDANDKSTERSSTSKKANSAYKTDTANRNGASRSRPRKGNNQANRDKDQGTELEPTSEQNQKAHSVATKADTSFPNPTKKDLLEEDNSINETDTITNTNDESNNTPTESKHPLCKESAVSEHDDAPLDTDEDDYDEDLDEESYLDLTKLQEGQAFNPETGFLLGHKDKKFGNKKCLILDLDETLVHSSFKYLRTADFVIPVEIDNQVHHVYVIKRPGVDEFLRKVGKWYEVVVFTASVAKYGDPLLDKLDVSRSVHHRLFRDSCYNYQGNFIKNLSQIGRPLADSIIIDNSPASYIFHPQHSIPISSWFSDTHDNELLDLLPFLEDISKPNVDDVGLVLDITL